MSSALTITHPFFLFLRRFWVLEGNVGHSSEEDDSVSIATEDFEAELQNSGPGPVRLFVQLY